MRRVLGWLLLLAGAAAVVAGALLATALRPPAELLATARLAEPGAAVVTAPGLLELTGPQARVEAASPGAEVFLAVAREEEAARWLGDVRRTELTGLTGSTDEPRLAQRPLGSEAAAADPRLADIWLASSTGQDEASLTWPRREGRYVLVAATDGTAPAPAQVQVAWTRTGPSATHPGARPLVAAGSAAALLGVVLLSVRRRSRGAHTAAPSRAPGAEEVRP